MITNPTKSQVLNPQINLAERVENSDAIPKIGEKHITSDEYQKESANGLNNKTSDNELQRIDEQDIINNYGPTINIVSVGSSRSKTVELLKKDPHKERNGKQNISDDVQKSRERQQRINMNPDEGESKFYDEEKGDENIGLDHLTVLTSHDLIKEPFTFFLLKFIYIEIKAKLIIYLFILQG